MFYWVAVGLWLFSLFATVYVIVVGFLSSATHLVFSGVRMLRGREGRFNWLVASRSLVILWALIGGAIVVFSTVYLIPYDSLTPSTQERVQTFIGFTLILLALIAVSVQVVSPIIEVLWRHQTSSVILSVMTAFALPFLSVLLFMLVCEIQDWLHQRVSVQDRALSIGVASEMGTETANGDPYRWNKAEEGAFPSGTPPSVQRDQPMPTDAFWPETYGVWVEQGVRDVSYDLFKPRLSAIGFNDFVFDGSWLMRSLRTLFRATFVAVFWANMFVLLRILSGIVTRHSE